METFKGIMYIVLGLGGILVVVFWAIYLIKQFCGIGKEIITENVHKKTDDTSNKLKMCPNGHLYKDTKECPYCTILKDFQPQKRELNLAEDRKHFQNNINFNKLINDCINAVQRDMYFSEWYAIYSSNNQNLPFHGGWGYTMDDTIIIDLSDNLSGILLEYKIAELRLKLELFYLRQRGDRYYDIQGKMKIQHLFNDSGKIYDSLEFEHICLYQTDYDELEKEYEQYEKNPTAYDSDFLLEHNKKRVSLMYHVYSEFFFDISKMKNSH